MQLGDALRLALDAQDGLAFPVGIGQRGFELVVGSNQTLRDVNGAGLWYGIVWYGMVLYYCIGVILLYCIEAMLLYYIGAMLFIIAMGQCYCIALGQY